MSGKYRSTDKKLLHRSKMTRHNLPVKEFKELEKYAEREHRSLANMVTILLIEALQHRRKTRGQSS